MAWKGRHNAKKICLQLLCTDSVVIYASMDKIMCLKFHLSNQKFTKGGVFTIYFGFYITLAF